MARRSSSNLTCSGIGGGGLYIPVLTIVAGFDLKTASSFSAFMVTGGSIANVMCNLCTGSDKFGGKTLLDYDIALLSEPFGIRRSEEKWLWEFEKWLVKNETSTKGSGEVESVREPLLGCRINLWHIEVSMDEVGDISHDLVLLLLPLSYSWQSVWRVMTYFLFFARLYIRLVIGIVLHLPMDDQVNEL
ncbi:hypothetical protein NC651_010195 [Populus alba x Populus x berolinensis]|nr:hypothetical protein NC651_010195 [Populus alba x Populus x berolinensis]